MDNGSCINCEVCDMFCFNILLTLVLLHAFLHILVQYRALDAFKQDLDRGVRNKDEQCRLFLAESSIPNAGFGVFVGEDIEGGEVISSHDISVPILNFNKKIARLNLKENAPLLESHMWDRFSGGSQWELENDVSVKIFLPIF